MRDRQWEGLGMGIFTNRVAGVPYGRFWAVGTLAEGGDPLGGALPGHRGCFWDSRSLARLGRGLLGCLGNLWGGEEVGQGELVETYKGALQRKCLIVVDI